MTDNSATDNTQGRQGGQPDGGHPQGGQPQGGQPQGGQPQGGQPAGEQSQGGQPQMGQPQGGQELTEKYSTEIEFAKLGVVVYAIFGIGLFLTESFKHVVANDDSVVSFTLTSLTNNGMFIASATSLQTFTTLAPIFGALLAYHYYRTGTRAAPKAGAIASAAGTLSIGLILAFFVTMFAPSLSNVGFGKEIPTLVGTVVGTAVVAGTTGYFLQRDPLDLLQ
ncbi:MAG: hypothetical protein V5A52_02160 [Halovenus sp.]|uniref:hypothetical protein n=1 Tax=Halovenus amylolytica TaxID=2500550 RepID=UPI000FE443D8